MEEIHNHLYAKFDCVKLSVLPTLQQYVLKWDIINTTLCKRDLIKILQLKPYVVYAVEDIIINFETNYFISYNTIFA